MSGALSDYFRDPVLVVVDLQNDFVRVGAPLEVPAARDTIAVNARLIAAFRAGDRPVVFLRYVADPLYRPLAGRLPWIALLDPPTNACVPGHMRTYPDVEGLRDCVAIVDELAPLPGEPVVDKPYYSAFHGTDFATLLKDLGAGTLVVTGTVTEMCVEDTARQAVHHGYATVIVRDAVSSAAPEVADAALAAFDRNFGWVVESGEIEALLAAPHTAARGAGT